MAAVSAQRFFLRPIVDSVRSLFWVYLLAIGAAEVVSSAVYPQLGLIVHALILIALLVHGGIGRSEEVRKLALALTIAPLIRLLSFSLPLTSFPQAAWYPIVSAPLLLSTWLIIRQLGLSRRELSLRTGNLPLQLLLLPGGVWLGGMEFVILRPAPLLDSFSWGAFLILALSLMIFTGFTEELIFRGLLQSLAGPVIGRGALVYVALLFAVLHAGYLSVLDVVFVFAVGWLFAYIVRWGGSILGVTLAHGITNITLFVVLPLWARQAGTIDVLRSSLLLAGTGLLALVAVVLLWLRYRHAERPLSLLYTLVSACYAQRMTRKPYPSDVSDDEWAFVAPYLMLKTEDAPQRDHPLREVFNGVRWLARTGGQWRMLPKDLPPWYTVYQQTQRWLNARVFEAMVHDLRRLLSEIEGRAPQPRADVLDGRTLQSSPESGEQAGYDGHKRRRGSKVYPAVDTLGQLLAVLVTPANEQERAQVSELAAAVQEATREMVEVAFVDQGYTGEQPAEAHGIRLEVVKLPTAKRGFVLLPQRWIVECSFGSMARFRRLARDYERLSETLAGLHFLASAETASSASVEDVGVVGAQL